MLKILGSSLMMLLWQRKASSSYFCVDSKNYVARICSSLGMRIWYSR